MGLVLCYIHCIWSHAAIKRQTKYLAESHLNRDYINQELKRCAKFCMIEVNQKILIFFFVTSFHCFDPMLEHSIVALKRGVANACTVIQISLSMSPLTQE